MGGLGRGIESGIDATPEYSSVAWRATLNPCSIWECRCPTFASMTPSSRSKCSAPVAPIVSRPLASTEVSEITWRHPVGSPCRKSIRNDLAHLSTACDRFQMSGMKFGSIAKCHAERLQQLSALDRLNAKRVGNRQRGCAVVFLLHLGELREGFCFRLLVKEPAVSPAAQLRVVTH